MKKWTDKENEFLINFYPDMGKNWCAKKLNRSVSSVRAHVSLMGLKQNTDSDYFKEWQSRAAKSKIGKKRPEQSLVMKKLWEEGKLKLTEEGRIKLSESTKQRIKLNGHPRGALGLKHTDEAKKKMSEESLKTWNSYTEDDIGRIFLKVMKTKYSKGNLIQERKNVSWKGGKRKINGKEIYFRSRWEANYARFLEWLKENKYIKEWEFETDIFWFEQIKRGTRCYIPDFKVIENNGSIIYHEVKGWMDDRSRTKLNRMEKYYPDIKIYLIDTVKYKELEKKMSSIIKEWE